MKTLVVILGTTAVGKTELALLTAERLSAHIVGADSRQIYRDIPIISAAPTEAEQTRVRHYFVGTHALTDRFSAAAFETAALDVIDREMRDRDFVVMSGGSMMYLDAVTHGIDDMPCVDADVRADVRRRYERNGLAPLLAQLRLLDPDYYARVDMRNPQRVIHGVEMCLSTGRPFSSFHTGQRKERPFRIVKIGLQRERQELYERIERRVGQMMADGAMDEARRVMSLVADDGGTPSPEALLALMARTPAINTVGLKELLLHLAGAHTHDEAVERIVHSTKIYSKKQMTWFRRDAEIHWLDAATTTADNIIRVVQA